VSGNTYTFNPHFNFFPYPHSFLRALHPVPADYHCLDIGRDIYYCESRDITVRAGRRLADSADAQARGCDEADEAKEDRAVAAPQSTQNSSVRVPMRL
jgi:hypothetical protein